MQEQHTIVQEEASSNEASIQPGSDEHGEAPLSTETAAHTSSDEPAEAAGSSKESAHGASDANRSFTPGRHGDLTVLEVAGGTSERSCKRQWPRGNTAAAAARAGRETLRLAAASDKHAIVSSSGGSEPVPGSMVQGSKPKFRWRLDQSTQRWVCDRPRCTDDGGERWWQAVEAEMSDDPHLPGSNQHHQMHEPLEQFCLSDSELWDSDDHTPREAKRHKHQGYINAEGMNGSSEVCIEGKRSLPVGSTVERPRKAMRPG